MATKERKVSVGRRQQTSSPSPKDSRSTPETVKNDPQIEAQKVILQKSNTKAPSKRPLVRKLTKGQKKKNNKKKISIKLTSKVTRKAKQTITKSLMNTAKVLDAKKLLKNGKVGQKNEKNEENSVTHILEPILRNEEVEKKQKNKRIVRNPAAKKVKTEVEDPEICSDSSGNSIRYSRRGKISCKIEELDTVAETIEGVVSGLTLGPDEIKKEPDSMSESSRSDIIKPKRLTKKQKLSLLQKEIKKENIENALTNIGQSDQKVIDMLDLNVLKVKKTYPTQKRRHTIEKYPMGQDYSGNDDFPPLIPFSDIPKAKRKGKCDNNKVLNPCTIRAPARLLRNGKQRKLKEQLVQGLEGRRKRKRLCSEASGAEILKLSEYESDGSFPDLLSIPGTDPTIDLRGVEIKKEQIDNCDSSSNLVPNIKRSLSLENQSYCTDSNSNLCDDPNKQANKNSETINEITMLNEDVYPSPSTKVPEKLLILDIMKQTFNERVDLDEMKVQSVEVPVEELSPIVIEEKESEQTKMSEIISKIVETMGTEEFTATINTTEEGPAVVMQNGDIPWEEDNVKIVEESVCPAEKVEEGKDNESMPQLTEELIENLTETIVISETSGISVDEEMLEEVNESTQTEPKETSLPPEVPEIAESEIPHIALNIPMEAIAGPSSAAEYSPPLLEPMDALPSTSKDYDLMPLVQETEEELAIKESMFNALGLRSLKAAEEAKLREKEKPASAKTDTYTGTLKTVIKLNRDGKRKGKNQPLKMTLQKNKSKNGDGASGSQDDYKIMKEGCSSWKNSGQSSDSAGAHRKLHYYNRSNLDGSSEHTTDAEAPNPEAPVKALVIPEKASSFSIHPERLCKDECSFCYGKFGLFDTPCHIAQIKTIERQEKILAIEKNLTKDSCLCDACYRHIDRRANTPSYTSKSVKRGPMIAPGPKKNHCHVLGCNNVSANILRRKWIIKMRQQVMQTVNIDLNNLGLHSIPICQEHYAALEHLMVCSMCKRRLAKNHIHYLGPEVEDLNNALNEEQIPLKLSDKPVVCKLCRCFATVILKNPEDRGENSADFFVEYKKRLLHFNNIVPMDKAAAEEPIVVPTREKIDKEPNKKKRKRSNEDDSSKPGSPSETITSQKNNNEQNGGTNSGSESPSEYLVDYHNLIPSIAMECEDNESDKDKSKKDEPRRKSVASEPPKKTSVENSSNDLMVQRLGANPYLSVRQLFPGEEEMGLQGHIDFNNVKERTTEGWEKCNMTVQYDKATKNLWQELQKPYGNPSSFMRHLILLEKYFRNGDLELKPNASQQSVNYSESVQNRLRAYDNIPTGVSRSFNVIDLNSSSPMQKSTSGIITSNKEAPVQTLVPGLPIMTTPNVTVTSVRPSPVTITQLNPILPVTITKSKPPPPPGLISLLPGTSRPVAPLTKQPQSQKIKFPITKNWRPTLIPIDPTKPTEKKTGLVQVISGGKPFHITLEDYKKMCAIKRSFEMKQKRQTDTPKKPTQVVSIGTSILKSNKGLVITKGPKIELKQEEPSDNILEKLDRQVENLESKFNENKLLNMPRIPKSLTVIPQTVRKLSRPASPVLLITPKPKS